MEQTGCKVKRRSKNFMSDEKELLLLILVKYKDVLENKLTTKEVNKMKEEAWIEITKEFNIKTRMNICRTFDQLKNLWENCRKEMRYQLAQIEGIKNGNPIVTVQPIAKRPKFDTSFPTIMDNEDGGSDISEISDKSWLMDDLSAGEPVEFRIPEELEFRPIRLTDPSKFNTVSTTQNPTVSETLTSRQAEQEEAKFKLQMQILEDQRLHNRELHVLEIKLARERLANEKLIAGRQLELLQMKIKKEK